MTDSNLFDDNSNTPGKYDSWDLEALRKKAYEADNHIDLVESEAKSLRELAQTNTTMDEIIARLDLMNMQPPMNHQPTTPANNAADRNVQDVVTKTDVATLVAQTLETLHKENSAKENVSKVKTELSKVWGTDVSKKLKEKAVELGVSERFLASMAEGYPTALLKLVLEDKPAPTNPNTHTPPSTTYRSLPSSDQPLSTWKQFSKAMKDNKHLRHDATFQRQLHETAEKQGPSFWN